MKKKNIFAKKVIGAILIMQMIVMTCLSVMVIMEITKIAKILQSTICRQSYRREARLWIIMYRNPR